jgi:hypothetical protein
MTMNEYSRPHKQIDQSAKSAERRGSPASSGVARGALKGKPLDEVLGAGRAKVSVAAARRAAAETERSAGPRKEIPLPMENPAVTDQTKDASLRLRLLVEGERIRVLDAIVVDVPAPQEPRIRGTSFLEVRAGDDVLTVQPLVDPGVEIGIPDPTDKTEFRGHREVEVPSYEVTVRVPLEAVEAVEAGVAPGGDTRPFEITVYQATENLEIDPARFDTTRRARGRLARVATTGRLSIRDVRSSKRDDNRKPEAKPRT